jgi:flavodoxin
MHSAGGRLSRRTVLKRALLLSTGAALPGGLAGCSSDAADPGARSEPAATAVATPAAESPEPTRTLLAYFSRAGENYHYGGRRDLDVGNTEVVSNMISQLAEVDVYRLQPADPYPHDYEQTVERNRQEQRSNARPALLEPPPPTTAYDTVLLGCPVWNSSTPMIMRTLLDSTDLSGKTVLPFVTYAVTGMSGIPDEYASLLPGSRLGEGLAVQGEEVQGAREQVQNWLRRVGIT